MNEVIIAEPANSRREETFGFAHQHGHLAACVIFRPLGKINQNERKRRVIHHEGGENTTNPYKLKIVCPWELDTEDESVLLVLISMIATHRRIQQIAPGHSCRKELKEKGAWSEEMTAATFTNRNEIIQKLGWNHEGRSYRRLNDSMERLNHALINYTPANGQEMQSKFISVSKWHKNGREIENKLLIALNPLSAAVIFGNCPNGISIHEILERRLLGHSQIALGIYSQLVYFNRPGNKSSRGIYLSTLLQRVYGLGENEHPTPKQRALVSKCIQKWDLPGWQVSISGRGKDTKVAAFRPKSGITLYKANDGHV